VKSKKRENLKGLLEAAHRIRRRAYAPYSKYRVGAALLTADGKIYTGANIENASYPAAVCAERVAIFKAVSEGRKRFKALAVAADPGKKPWPCGVCRQVLWELAGDIEIVIQVGKKQESRKLKGLYPDPF
jgi:cytidine deaminase